MESTTYGDLIENIKNEIEKQIKENQSYSMKDVIDYISEYYRELSYDKTINDTTIENEDMVFTHYELNNIVDNKISVMRFHPIYRKDNRCKNGYSSKLLYIEVENLLSDEYITWDVRDISQGLEYLIEKREREKLIVRCVKMEEEIKKIKDSCKRIESLMRRDAWNSKMLHNDLN